MTKNKNMETSSLNLSDHSEGLLVLRSGSGDRIINSIEYNSREVKEGSCFAAVKGFVSDGHDYIGSAIENGASAIIISDKRADVYDRIKKSGVDVMMTGDSRKALSKASSLFYGNSSSEMVVIGITGTNGKTSIVYMMEKIFHSLNIKTGVIGTVSHRWGDVVIPAENTTPESKDLQELLYKMKNDSVKVVLMEVSSHALFLDRADDIEFDGVIFTNLTPEHLDFHKNMEDYFNAKKILFGRLEKSSKKNRFAVVNIDDEFGARLYSSKDEYSFEMNSFAVDRDSDYRAVADSVENSFTGLSYSIENSNSLHDVNLKISGSFHVYNSLSAIALLNSMGYEMDDILKGLSELKSVPGRFDIINSNLGFGVVIDYAHTGDALDKLLKSAQGIPHNRIITLFGCGGDRDKKKRPEMGRIAEDNSDVIIVTSDNPRTEDPDAIIDDIVKGIVNKKYIRMVDRKEAIKKAVNLSEKDDIIIIAGKGHEDYQILGKEKIHFDDKEIVNDFISKRKGA